MDKCVVCGGEEFYVEAGYYFCQECQTQHEGKREEFTEFHVDTKTRLRRTRIRKNKLNSNTDQIVGWTTWEKFNFILIGLANELIDLGASMDIKFTLVQLWATYLGKLEIAFTSINKKTVPKLTRRYSKRDAEIIYGRILQRKRKKRSKSVGSGTSVSSGVTSSFVSGASSKAELQRHKKKMVASEYDRYMQSQDSEVDSVTNQSLASFASSGSDDTNKGGEKIRLNKYAKKDVKQVKLLAKLVPKLKKKEFKEKHVTASYLCGPQIITPSRLWGLIHLALRINDDKIHLSDMLRFSREGHLSYYRLEHLLPSDVSLSKVEVSNLNPVKEISHKGMRRLITQLAKFLGVLQIPHPNLLSLIERYVTELQLPKGILIYAERMIAISPPNMEFNANSTLFPNYEGRAMAFIIVVMKILFGLDGITEFEISRVIERINTVAEERGKLESRLFNFCEWQRYIECRRCILIKEHFPTKLKRDPHSTESSHLYVKFIQSIQSKYEGDEAEMTKFKNLVPRDLGNMMNQCIEQLKENMPSTEDAVTFSPSLTSQHAYLQQLLENNDKDLPTILRQDFFATKVGYMLKPESLEELAAQCNIELHVVAASAHFMEKIVQVFEPPMVPPIKKQKHENTHNKLTQVITPSPEISSKTKSEEPSEYLHRRYPGTIIINKKKQRLYDKCQNTIKSQQNVSYDDFDFDQVLPNGKLNIPNSNDDSDHENSISKNVNEDYRLMLSNFEKKTMLNPVDNPWAKYKKTRHNKRLNGKFVKTTEEVNSDIVNCEQVDNAAKCQNQKEILLIDDDIQDVDDNDDCNSDPIMLKEILKPNATMHDSDSDEISILTESINSRRNSNIMNNSTIPKLEILTLFRPFKQYWLHRCMHFSHISAQHFRILERDFSMNFRWLLRECAHIVEMNIEDLYEEVCLVESYYADVLSSTNDPDMCKKYDTSHYRSQAHSKAVNKKWNS